jgi:hypothetical protein
MEGSVHICQNQISVQKWTQISVQKWTQISVSGFEIPRIQRSDFDNRETKKPNTTPMAINFFIPFSQFFFIHSCC